VNNWGRSKYHNYGIGGWRGMFVVWVLRSGCGTEYIAGEDAVPPPERMGDVIARIGPIAYEEGQGLERFKQWIAEDVKVAEQEYLKKHEREQMLETVRREVEARMPKPPEPEAVPQDSA